MPLYEYRCLSCGHVFDVIQKLSDPPLTECPECGEAVEKCVSSPAIQFKGSGFYITDYANKAKKPGKEPKKGKADKKDSGGDKGSGPSGGSANGSGGTAGTPTAKSGS